VCRDALEVNGVDLLEWGDLPVFCGRPWIFADDSPVGDNPDGKAMVMELSVGPGRVDVVWGWLQSEWGADKGGWILAAVLFRLYP
jgi:hypothetical protein